MTILTGATGKLGKLVAERLLETTPAAEVGVSVRDPKKARSLVERGVRVRAGDYEEPASLHHAFEGADTILLVSSGVTGEAALRNHRHAIEAAKAVGARRVVYTSHMGVGATSLFSPMTVHAATEAMLQASGLAFASLRNGFYADSGLMLTGNAIETGEIVAPEDGPVSWTTHADLAEVAAIALAQPERLDGLTPPLTGSEALDLDGLAALASELTGRTIRRVTVGDEAFRTTLIARGVPEARAEMMLGLFAASRKGEFAAVDPTLERLLGRPPIPMGDFLVARLPG